MLNRMSLKPIAMAMLAAVSATNFAIAETFVVSNESEFTDALSSVEGGDEIVLEPGHYGTHTIPSFTPDSVVVIRSQDPDNKSEFDSLRIVNSANLTLESLRLNAKFGAETDFVAQEALDIDSSDRISVLNSDFVGDMVLEGEGKPDDINDDTLAKNDPIEGFYIGYGTKTLRSTNIVYRDNSFTEFFIGAQFLDIDGLEFSGNELFNNRSDGLNFAQISNAVIKDNMVGKLTPWTGPGGTIDSVVGDHPDLMQFWTTRTDEPSRNVRVVNNYLAGGTEIYYIQGIFIRNEELDRGRWPDGTQYSDFFICGNYIENSQVHGITLSDVVNSEVMHNIVIRNDYSDADGNGVDPAIYLRQTSGAIHFRNNVVARLEDETEGELYVGYGTNRVVTDFENWRMTAEEFFDLSVEANANRVEACNPAGSTDAVEASAL